MSKDLKEKAINIKGKQYVQVSDRILYFNEEYPFGGISTELIRYEDKRIVMKCTVFPGEENHIRCFTGYAQEVEGDGYINKTSALENAETSAVGRALAMMGIGVIDSIASIDEINKANNRTKAPESESKPQTEGNPVDTAREEANGIINQIELCTELSQLTEIWNKLDEKEKEMYETLFTNRKQLINE